MIHGVVASGKRRGAGTVSLVGTTDASYASASSIGRAIPSGVAVGDVAVAFLCHRWTVTPPSGWTLVGTASVNSADNSITQYLSVYTRTIQSGDAGSTATFSQQYSDSIAMAIGAYHGSSGTPTVKASNASNVAEGAASGGTNYPAAGVTSTSAGQMIVTGEAAVYGNNGSTFSVPSGVNQDTTSTISGGQARMAVGHKSTSGETFSGNFSYNVVTAMACFSLVLG